MELTELFQAGMTSEERFTVEEKHLAPHVGSGSARVLATPWMIGFMEGVSHRLLVKHLPEGYSSVGIVVDIKHLAPTPLGGIVTVKSEIASLSGNLVEFSVDAWDEHEQIGTGHHRRAVIDHERFLRRVEAKSIQSDKPA